MDLSLFLRGAVIGFSIAAPVGPISVLCIQRTLSEGRLSGFISGLGAATADGIYGCIGGFGVTFISKFLVSQQFWFRLMGGLFLCYLGFKTFWRKPSGVRVSDAGHGLVGAYLSTLLLTLTNPITILFFAAIFSGLGGGGTGTTYVSAILFVFGVFSGSAVWWFVLAGGTGLFRTTLSPTRRRWLNRISGIILVGFGVFALVGLK